MQFFKNKHDITAWLKDMGIHNYVIQPSGFVDVMQGVNLSQKNLSFIPVQFGEVKGNFNCSHNALISLLGAPHTLIQGYHFVCSHNLLTSLDGAPKRVDFFACDNNRLTSLEKCPEHVTYEFICSHNQLNTVEYLPRSAGRLFICQGNPELGEIQHISDFILIEQKQKELLDIKKEKNDLSTCITSNRLSQKIQKI